jgi:hypothetical protein
VSLAHTGSKQPAEDSGIIKDEIISPFPLPSPNTMEEKEFSGGQGGSGDE